MTYPRLTNEEFATIYHKVPRAAVDIIVQTSEGIVLTKRAIPPFVGMWHICGGTILFMEPINHAIDRIILDIYSKRREALNYRESRRFSCTGAIIRGCNKSSEADTAQQELAGMPLDEPAPKRDSRTAMKSRGLGVF